MRNRTEQVTTTLDGSDEEEQLDSGGSDWQPEEDEKPKPGRKSARASAGVKGGKAKNGAKGARGAGKKRKKDDSDEEEDESAEEEESEEEVSLENCSVIPSFFCPDLW